MWKFIRRIYCIIAHGRKYRKTDYIHNRKHSWYRIYRCGNCGVVMCKCIGRQSDIQN